VDRILFRSLPYPNDAGLVSVGMTAPIAPQEFLLGYDYLDWRAASTPFASMGVWSGVSDCDLSDANPVRLQCGIVDSHLLPTLGIQPLLGHNFTSEEDQPRVPKVALISYGLWRGRFAGDAGVVGKAISLDGQPATIIGVLPPQFELPTLASVDMLVPQALDVSATVSRRHTTLLCAVGRLKPGASMEQARAALGPLFTNSMKDVPPNFRKDVSLRLRPLRDLQIHDSRLASWILLAAVLAVLLIACANVANLLLARAAGRRRELAVRAALGAPRVRLVRQALTESLLLAAAGGVAGCALAMLLLRGFVAIAPEGFRASMRRPWTHGYCCLRARYRSPPVCCSDSHRRSKIHAPRRWPAGVPSARAVTFSVRRWWLRRSPSRWCCWRGRACSCVVCGIWKISRSACAWMAS
jgi:predicted permease